MLAKSLKSCPALWTLWAVTHQASLSMGILQARILESVAIPSSRGYSLEVGRDGTCISWDCCITGRFFTIEPQEDPQNEGDNPQNERVENIKTAVSSTMNVGFHFTIE